MKKIWILFKDFIVKWLVEIVTFSGISVITIIAYIKGLLNHSIEIKIWQSILIISSLIFSIFFIWFLKIKLNSKQKFPEGTKVILSTGKLPIMSVGKYNFFNNKVECTWSVNNTIKKEYINQNLLKEYKYTKTDPITKIPSIW